MNKTDLKTAAMYIRVSTECQTELSPDSQIKAIQQYAKQNGYIVPNEFIFRDDGISGRTAEKRPQFNQMIATAKQNPPPFSAVLLWKFSRFARNQEESIFYKSMLRKSGIEVISISEPTIDGAFGTLIERIIEWSDEYYSIRLSGEVKRGMTEKVERGEPVANAAYGYKMVNKRLVINPDTAPIVQKIFSDYLAGVPVKRITTTMNDIGIKTARGGKWDRRTVEYILKNPVYIGKIRWNPKRPTKRNYNDPDIMIVDGSHDPIIDTETFNATQKKLEQTQKTYLKYAHEKTTVDFMLRGLVKCSNCGGALSNISKGKAIQCTNYTRGSCRVSHYIGMDKINEIVLAAIDYAFSTGDFFLTVKTPKDNAPEINTAALIQKEHLKLSRVRDAYEDGIYTLTEYKERRQSIENRIDRLKQTAVSPPIDLNTKRKELIDKNKNALIQLRDPDVSETEKREILTGFISKITFDRQRNSVAIFFYS